VYYGDEIGMHDVPIPPHWVRDPFEKNLPGLGLGRDPVRTPMQWSDGQWADFSTVPLADDFMKCNVSVESDDADSLLALYR
jgi:alpha-glucosidase